MVVDRENIAVLLVERQLQFAVVVVFVVDFVGFVQMPFLCSVQVTIAVDYLIVELLLVTLFAAVVVADAVDVVANVKDKLEGKTLVHRIKINYLIDGCSIVLQFTGCVICSRIRTRCRW